MQNQLDAVAAFHNAFGVGMANQPTANASEAINQLRHKLMAEENNEYLEAANNNDLVEVAHRKFSLRMETYLGARLGVGNSGKR